MNISIPIAGNVHWVGVNDRQTDLFEGVWPIQEGITYNSYLITGQKTALLDTVKENTYTGFLEGIGSVLEYGQKIDYLVIHHLEPDHSGAICQLMELFPEIRIVGNKKTAEFLGHLHGITERVDIVCDGDELDLGGRKLKFIMAPMIHWPETMMSYEPDSRILFSGDAFGSYGALDGDVLDVNLDFDYYEGQALRYYSNIIGKYGIPVQKALEKINGVEVDIIASTHGPVWKNRVAQIIKLYDKWSRMQGDDGVVIAYGSMYGNTVKMAEAVAAGISEAGQVEVKIHDLSRTHPSYVLSDIWKYKGLILGCPTYDGGIFWPVENLVRLLQEKKISNRIVGVFGSYGWSGGAVRGLVEFAKNSKVVLAEPVVEARFSANEELIGNCRQLGKNVAFAIKDI